MGRLCRRCPGRHACSLRNQAKPQIAVSQELKYRENVCDAGYPSAAVVLLALTLIMTALTSPAVRPWAKAIPEGCGRSCRGLPVPAAQGHRAAVQRPGASGSRGWGLPRCRTAGHGWAWASAHLEAPSASSSHRCANRVRHFTHSLALLLCFK